MGEVKQTNFRIDQETAALFRDFCEKNNLSQAQGFDHIMQVVEMDQAKAVVPERKTEIEAFEKAIKDIMAAYLNSVELGKTAEDRAKENFKSLLESKDKMIAELQGKVETLKADKEEAEQLALTSSSAVAQALKDSEIAKEQAEMSKKLLAEKEKTISTLAEKLTKSEEKAEEYDSLSETSKKLLEENKELHRALERKDSDSKKDMELAVAKAVAEKEKEMMKRMMELEKENAKLTVKVELLEK